LSSLVANESVAPSERLRATNQSIPGENDAAKREACPWPYVVDRRPMLEAPVTTHWPRDPKGDAGGSGARGSSGSGVGVAGAGVAALVGAESESLSRMWSP